jgi:hypothetical protein
MRWLGVKVNSVAAKSSTSWGRFRHKREEAPRQRSSHATLLLANQARSAPGAWLLHLLGLRSKTMQGNWRAALLQYRALQHGLWCYNLLTERKPAGVVVPSVWETTALEEV